MSNFRKSVPTVPETDGNSGTSVSNCTNALYKYDFVINNYTPDELCQLNDTLRKITKKSKYGLEVGESGTPHVQGFMSLIKKERIAGLHKYAGLERASFRKIRNEKACEAYCEKDGLVFSHGYPEPIIHYCMFNTWQKFCIDEMNRPADNRTINWFWSDKGKVGKTALIRYLVDKHKAQFASGGKYTDVMNLVYHTNMDECRCVLFVLPREHKNHISYSALESVKDGLVSNMKSYQNGSKIFNPPHVFVFANYPPDDRNLSVDRWNIIQLDYLHNQFTPKHYD